MKKSNLLILVGIVIAVTALTLATALVNPGQVALNESKLIPFMDLFNINTILNLIIQK